MGAFVRGAAILAGLLIIANIVGMLTRPDTVQVPTFETSSVATTVPESVGPCSGSSPIVERWEDGSAVRLDGCTIDAETREIAPPTVRLDVNKVTPVLWDGLIARGFVGYPHDGAEALYVPAGTVVDFPGGTWTVTKDTCPRMCLDGTNGQECTGREFLPGF